MFLTREKEVVRPISQHNKRKQKHNDQILLSLLKLLLYLNLLPSRLKNLSL